mmetsp:Transcript_35340/g.75321  ORF Transcript_35340/g.75321 Transcript_35340/m.75321 type:complete len:449 (+) Transcript_35340:104-1450(+)
MTSFGGLPPPSKDFPSHHDTLRFEALGLPDPVALAALTALGAIPNPMAVLSQLLVNAQGKLEEFADFPTETGGGSSPSRPARQPPRQAIPGDYLRLDDTAARSEAARLREDSLKQAQLAVGRAKELAVTAAANREAIQVDWEAANRMAREAVQSKDLSNIFSVGDDAEAVPTRKGTLSSLLRGLNGLQDTVNAVSSNSTGSRGPGKIRFSKLNPATTEGELRLELARHGALSSVILDSESSTAYASFSSSLPSVAKSLSSRASSTLLDGVQVDLVYDLPERVRLAAAAAARKEVVEEPLDPTTLPEHLRRAKKERKRKSRSRHKKRRSRSRKKRSRSGDRWWERSRSNSHTATGQYIRAVGCSSTVRWWEKKKGESSASSSSSDSERKVEESKRPRQVALKGQWAQMAHQGQSYFYHIPTGRTTWEKPSSFESSSKRSAEESKKTCFL